MTTVNLSDLMKELQAGEEARAAVPALQSRIEDLSFQRDRAQKHNQGLEENIIDYKRAIDDLTSKVRSLEVERDDAGFRELEAQDKLNRLLEAARAAISNLWNDVTSIDPPAPTPPAPSPVQDAPMPVKLMEGFLGDMTNPTAVANVPVTEGPSATDPTSASLTIPYQAPVQSAGADTTAASSEGPSDPFPPASAPLTAPTPTTASGSDAAKPEAAVSMTEDRPATPYADRPYWEKPSGMPWQEWADKGGRT